MALPVRSGPSANVPKSRRFFLESSPQRTRHPSPTTRDGKRIQPSYSRQRNDACNTEKVWNQCTGSSHWPTQHLHPLPQDSGAGKNVQLKIRERSLMCSHTTVYNIDYYPVSDLFQNETSQPCRVHPSLRQLMRKRFTKDAENEEK